MGFPALHTGASTRPSLAHPVCAQVLLAGWGEVAHSVAMRAYECSDEEWAVRDPALARCTGRYWVVSAGRGVGSGRCGPRGSSRLPVQAPVCLVTSAASGAMATQPTPTPPRVPPPQNRKPRLSPKGAHSLTAQQRLWDILVQQTGTDFVLPQPAAAEA